MCIFLLHVIFVLLHDFCHSKLLVCVKFLQSVSFCLIQIFMYALISAVKKKAHVWYGGGPPTVEFTPAESVALDQNRGRPMMKGSEGGSATGSATELQTAPFIRGT